MTSTGNESVDANKLSSLTLTAMQQGLYGLNTPGLSPIR
jgi:hypothetical protein